MISDASTNKAYVWTWLPGATEPVPAGVIEAHTVSDATSIITFAYGQSYQARADAIPLYLPELPLQPGRIEPQAGLSVAGVIRDAGPDAWGQRVVMRRLLGRASTKADPASVPLLTYLLQSGSNRPGALDFQTSPKHYGPRESEATVEELMDAADKVLGGQALDDHLAQALAAGSSAGGARPKATLRYGDKEVIAKFSSLTDPYPVMKAEAAAMELARRVGLNVAATELIDVAGREVLLVERFDRSSDNTRRGFVSALTILALDEMNARYATYHDLADVIRERFVHRTEALRELFARIVFNICVGNNDDHARNHAAFWDGERLELTPAYDICPQARVGEEQAQAMAIAPNGARLSQVATCLAAAEHYDLSANDAREIIDRQIDVIHSEWSDVAEQTRLTADEQNMLWGNQILNPFATYGYKSAS